MANVLLPRGVEVRTFDLILEACTVQERTDLLQAALERALVQGNIDVATRLLAAGTMIGNAIHAAIPGLPLEWDPSIAGGHQVMIERLLNGASVHSKDDMGRTPLHVAARCGKTAMVQPLVQRGGKMDVRDNDGRTPLLLAAAQGKWGAAIALMAAGADVDKIGGEDNRSVLHIAAEHERMDIMRAAITRSKNSSTLVNVVDISQDSALHRAAFNNNVEAINALVEAGGNTEATNGHGRSPLHEAASAHSADAVRALLAHGAYINAQDDHNETPLYKAAFMAGREGAADMVDLLLQSGADMTIVDGDNRAAVDVIGDWFVGRQEEEPLVEDIERVLLLLPPM